MFLQEILINLNNAFYDLRMFLIHTLHNCYMARPHTPPPPSKYMYIKITVEIY